MKKLKYALTLLPPVLSAGALLWQLETYHVHMDADFGASLIAGFFVVISLIVLLSSLRKDRPRAYRIACTAGLVLCFALFLIARTVPNCPMCDGWQEGEFHLLSHWISAGP